MTVLTMVVDALLALLLALLPGDVTVSHNMPPTVVAGQEVMVTFTVRKGDLNGFARFQLEVPEGFSVEPVGNEGSTFTFEENTAKWVWASVPVEEEFKVLAKLVASESAVGVQVLQPRYSYVENNEKQTAEIKPIQVNVLGPGAVVTPIPTVTEPTVATVEELVPELDTVQVSAAAEPPGSVRGERRISKGTDGEMLVTVNINKDATTGFARYSEAIPPGASVRAVKTDGASFSVSDGKLRFVWVNVPPRETIEICYAVKGADNARMNGEYAYLEQNQSKKFKMPRQPLTPDESKQEVAETKTPETASNEAAEDNAKVAQRVESSGRVQPPSTHDVVFHVQIGAFKNGKVTAALLKKRFGVAEKISSEMQEGLNKFMVGDHVKYKDARDHREKMVANHRIRSAFVVAYASGKRITVQEALMINKQQWFK